MRYVGLMPVFVLAACGGGSGGGPAIAPSPVDQSVGGIWQGMDSDGDEIFGLVTENGALHLIDAFGQGFGTATVSNGDRVSASYTYVVNLGTALPDGSTSEACTATGTVTERQSLDVDVDCVTEKGNGVHVSATLSYNPLYERDASLATIAGFYDDSGDVLTIDATGALFEQYATEGCTLNGQVSVLDPSYNAYGVEFSVAGCNPGSQELDGTTWSGIATLDNAVSPEELVYGVVGDVMVSGETVSFAVVGIAPRT